MGTPLYPGYMAPPLNFPICPTCNQYVGDGNQLQRQLSDALSQISQLRQENEQKQKTIANIQANAEKDQAHFNDLTRQMNDIKANASDAWKIVALHLGEQIPQPPPGLEYQGGPVYGPEFVLGIITKLKAERTFHKEMATLAQGRIAGLQQTMDATMKELATQVTSGLALPAPKKSKSNVIDAEVVEEE